MSAEQLIERAGAIAAILAGRSVYELSDSETLALLDAVGAAHHSLSGIGAEVADSVARRELATRQGERTADLIAARLGVPVREAREWCLVGAAIAPRFALTGEPLPPERPGVAAAMAEGGLPLAAAAVIARAVERLTPFTDRATLDALEQTLVERSAHLSLRELAILGRRAIDIVDPDGAEPREDLLRARSGLSISRTPDGMVRWVISMHPEAAGYLTTALDARTAPRRRPAFGNDADVDADTDSRTLGQRRLDALTDMARESIQHDTGEVAGSAVTMLVTVALDDLRSGIGTAQIAGVDEPISAATARRLAACATIIPAVLGGPSQPLDLGREERLFSQSQRRALAIRDGGCVWPGCTAPPGWCEVAHLLSWLDGGGTDLDNGVLMCPFHHRRLDRDGWSLAWRSGELWLTPPAHIDPRRTPRRAGRVAELV
jgi:hypothetical protein